MRRLTLPLTLPLFWSGGGPAADQGGVPSNAILLNGQAIKFNGPYILFTKASVT